jgi:hypothetical protein
MHFSTARETRHWSRLEWGRQTWRNRGRAIRHPADSGGHPSGLAPDWKKTAYLFDANMEYLLSGDEVFI